MTRMGKRECVLSDKAKKKKSPAEAEAAEAEAEAEAQAAQPQQVAPLHMQAVREAVQEALQQRRKDPERRRKDLQQRGVRPMADRPLLQMVPGRKEI